jgi:transcription initiation factor TFIID TATA-box-binding protein
LVEDVEIRIHNMVATAKFKNTLDLGAIVKAFPEVEYRPQVFPGLVLKLKKPRTSMLIFETGKVVCTGAKSDKEAKRAVAKLVSEFEGAGIVMVDRKPEIKVVNIVASIDLETFSTSRISSPP